MSKGVKKDVVLKVCIHSCLFSGILMELYDQGNFVALAGTIRNLLLQFKFKGSPKNKSARVTRVVVNE